MNSILSVAGLGHCSAKPTDSGSVYHVEHLDASKKKVDLPVPEVAKRSEAPKKKVQELPRKVKIADFVSAHLK